MGFLTGFITFYLPQTRDTVSNKLMTSDMTCKQDTQILSTGTQITKMLDATRDIREKLCCVLYIHDCRRGKEGKARTLIGKVSLFSR